MVAGAQAGSLFWRLGLMDDGFSSGLGIAGRIVDDLKIQINSAANSMKASLKSVNGTDLTSGFAEARRQAMEFRESLGKTSMEIRAPASQQVDALRENITARYAKSDALRVQMADQLIGLEKSHTREILNQRNALAEAAAFEQSALGIIVQETVATSRLAKIRETINAGGIKSIGSMFLKGAGLAIVTSEFNRFFTEINKQFDDVASGALTTGEAIKNIVSSIPIIGNAFQMGQQLQSMLTGASREIARMNAEANRGNALADRMAEQNKAAGDLKKTVENLTVSLGRLAEAGALGADPERLRVQNDFSDRQQQIMEQRKATEKLDPKTQSQMRARALAMLDQAEIDNATIRDQRLAKLDELKRDKQIEINRELQKIQIETNQIAIKATDEQFAYELAIIQENYRRRIEEAKDYQQKLALVEQQKSAEALALQEELKRTEKEAADFAKERGDALKGLLQFTGTADEAAAARIRDDAAALKEQLASVGQLTADVIAKIDASMSGKIADLKQTEKETKTATFTGIADMWSQLQMKIFSVGTRQDRAARETAQNTRRSVEQQQTTNALVKELIAMGRAGVLLP